MSIDPNIPAEITSPMNTVTTKNMTLSSSINIYFNTKGIMIALASIVGRGASHKCFLSICAPIAPISVAREPNTISRMFPDVRRFASTHPMVRPGIAADVKQGSTHKASEKRHCITPDASPKTFESRVRATYIAAIRAAEHIYLILILEFDLRFVVLLFPMFITLLSFVFREDGYELTIADATGQVYHK